VRAAAEEVRRNPFQYAVHAGDLRHYVLDGWPYSLLYLVSDDAVLIVAVFHDRRDPRDWQSRL
jgi:plasmid stabilization system protein ParE